MTKTFLVQIESPGPERCIVVTGCPEDAESVLSDGITRAGRPGETIIHATEASEYVAYWNSEAEYHEEGESNDIRTIARWRDASFREVPYEQALVELRAVRAGRQ
jgi:hypothetical protein